MSKLRLATFNCENLFSRPKVFGTTSRKAKELLGYIEELNNELSKAVFDQQRIAELKNKLKYYIRIQDIRGKHTSASGAGEWLGWIEFKRDPADEEAIENVARVMHAIDADIIALVEVENRPLLEDFHDKILFKKFYNQNPDKVYEHIYLIDGNDNRGIDVAVMSRMPVNFLKSHINEKSEYFGKMVNTFSRDCLQVNIQINEANNLNLFINHFKSMGYSDPRDPQSEKRRRGQSERVKEIIQQYDLNNELIAVVGDLNSSPEKWSMKPLTEFSDIYNVNLKLPASERGTYRYKSAKSQLDYILVSNALKSKLENVQIERRGTYTRRGPNFPSVVSRKTEASDHGAIVADFEF
ncbi:endonuclease/exonuclease/phosphatase family protein [Seonamhaeicola aphaedonensis]|uniref:Endonuclease/exonuclease/phosphatase family protein n=1 Tax=Seonamhaeicola aphaedonensis TaxID=1461338 RepID=A0A3D9H846_9FLAO|nr:endonuclease/exonuclease/phosphatase family protein [Seonamhaeicola aphaedonensis]RED45668.1 endonuclease/exonuclease/phosphatase family protein [Seonamhaeicola aphaedonensis]